MEPIYNYKYLTGNKLELYRQLYPVVENGELTCWFAKIIDGGDYLFYYAPYIDKVKSLVSEGTEFAIIEDQGTTYLYDGKELHELETVPIIGCFHDDRLAKIDSVKDIRRMKIERNRLPDEDNAQYFRETGMTE